MVPLVASGVAGIEDEFAGADLGDARLERRLLTIAEHLEADPAASFPEAMGDDSELEGLYRLLGNKRLGWDRILDPHVRETAARCATARRVIVVHDPTEFRFQGIPGARKGLGYLIKGSQRGFDGHFALALSDDGQNRPLGVLGFAPLVRPKPKRFPSKAAASRHTTLKKRSERESAFWDGSVLRAQRRLGTTSAIHVMDREADDYALFSNMMTNGARFVIRSRFDRKFQGTDGERTSLVAEVAKVEGQLLREVNVSPYTHKYTYSGAKRPDRSRRMATLIVRGTSVTLTRPQFAEGPRETTVNVVDVFEPKPPKGEEPIHWRLLTSEPIATVEQMARVVDIYRTRWVIEEYFKALKTGCAYERRQLMSLSALLKALALLAPIAWRLLLLRTLARANADLPAKEIATDDEILLLRQISRRVKLAAKPSCDEFLRAIAGLGGHLKRNGPPGWQTIWRGYDKFLAAQLGWAARARCDQS